MPKMNHNDSVNGVPDLPALNAPRPNGPRVIPPSHLVSECHRLRKLQLRSFTIENLRIMLGQNIGSRYLVPIALEHLEADPFAAGDFYPGDLLCNVLTLPHEFWREIPDLKRRVAARAIIDLRSGEHDRSVIVEKAVHKAHDAFLANGKLAV